MTVVVRDPGVVWAGAKTHWVSAVAKSATCLSGGTTHLNVSDFSTALSTYLPANGDEQILFERGETFFGSGGTFGFLPGYKKVLIEAYGSGAKPKIALSSGGSLLGAGCDQASADDFAPQDARLMNINIEGSRARTISSGSDSDSSNRNLTYAARRSAFCGNTLGSVQDDGSEHVARMQGLERNVIRRNHWTGPTAVHQMKAHVTGTDDEIYIGTEQFTIIEGKLYERIDTGSPWSLGQENGVAADGCDCREYNKKMHVLGNLFHDETGSVNSGIEIHGD
ncbi:MAG: hypothetical protein ACN4G0_07215 [Polyangiales bacterium]